MIEFIRAGSDYLGLDNISKIKCPDCNRSFMQKSKFHPTKVVCFECGLKIDESELKQEEKFIPGIGQYSKPFLNQKAANNPNRLLDISERQGFVIDTTDEQKLESFSLKGMALKKTGDMDLSSSKQISDKTVEAVKHIVDALGSTKQVKVHLE